MNEIDKTNETIKTIYLANEVPYDYNDEYYFAAEGQMPLRAFNNREDAEAYLNKILLEEVRKDNNSLPKLDALHMDIDQVWTEELIECYNKMAVKYGEPMINTGKDVFYSEVNFTDLAQKASDEEVLEFIDILDFPFYYVSEISYEEISSLNS